MAALFWCHSFTVALYLSFALFIDIWFHLC